MPPDDAEQFVSEPMRPVRGTADARAMSRGEPGLPERFIWRGAEYRIAGVIGKWKSTGPCTSGSGEMYVRRHWYKIVTHPPGTMTIYCDRQHKDRKHPKSRWWVYSASASES